MLGLCQVVMELQLKNEKEMEEQRLFARLVLEKILPMCKGDMDKAAELIAREVYGDVEVNRMEV